MSIYFSWNYIDSHSNWCHVIALQRRRVVIQVVDQHQRHRDVRRERHVVIDGDLPEFVRRGRQVLPIRRAELHDALLVVDLRRFPAESHQGRRRWWHIKLHPEQRVDAGQAPRGQKRRLLFVLRRALPGCDVHDPDAPEASFLRLQHDLALPADHAGRPARLLHSERLWREGDHGYHHAAFHDRVSDAGRRKHAPNFRCPTSGRWVETRIMMCVRWGGGGYFNMSLAQHPCPWWWHLMMFDPPCSITTWSKDHKTLAL